MRVAHVDTASTWRGGEGQVLSLARGLARRGHDVLVICPPRSELAEACARHHVPTRAVAMRAEFDVGAMISVARALRGFRADIVHFHTARAHAIGLAAARLARTPVKVLSRRVDFPIGGNPFSRMKYKARVDAVVAISEAVREVLLAGGMAPGLITVIYSGVDLEQWDGKLEGRRFRAELGIPPSAPLVGVVGALAPHKAQSYFLRAAAELARTRPDVRYVIVGEGELEQELKELARSLGIERIVAFAGFRRNMRAVFAAIDVFVLSSVAEGLCTSIMDAMACGVPVVATRVGGVPEIIRDADCGILVPPADPSAMAAAIGRVLKDSSLRSRLVKGGRDRVLDFSVEKTVEQTEQLYSKLLIAKRGWVN
jgi:glycosyltransferase involved in cell wall biosynthesis